MDPALLKERANFMNTMSRARALPTVVKRKFCSSHLSFKRKKAKVSSFKPKEPKLSSATIYSKTVKGISKVKLRILAKVVDFMKKRHQDKDTNNPLSIDEILHSTNQVDIGNKNKDWLITEALPNNPKIMVVQEDGVAKYKYKLMYELMDREGFLTLLKKQEGLLLDDIDECLPCCQYVLRRFDDSILYITRPSDKKKIMFYDDKYHLNFDEEFIKLWRDVPVAGLNDIQITDYLKEQGIISMQDVRPKTGTQVQEREDKGGKRTFKKHNKHLAEVLQDYV